MKKILFSSCLFLWIACGDAPPTFKPIVEMPKVAISEEQHFRIGVVGSGIGGASFVHFINKIKTKLDLKENLSPFQSLPPGTKCANHSSVHRFQVLLASSLYPCK